MKITFAAVTAIAGLVVSSAADAAIVKYKATLNGAQVNPAVDTTSTGTADLDFDDTAKTLYGLIDVTMADGSKVTSAAIHQAACGDSGSIVKNLKLADPFNGIIAIDSSDPVKLSDSAATALGEGRLYINVRTETNANGEIRGQIYPENSTETCPPSGGSGSDGGSTTTPTDGGGNTSSSGGSTSDAGTGGPPPAGDDGGCSTTGSSNGSNGMVVALGAGLVLAAFSRRSKRATKR